MNENVLDIRFGHGLGDCANWARALQLWRKRGYRVRVDFEDNKAWLWEAMGIEKLPCGEGASVEFMHPPGFNHSDATELDGNKIAWNLVQPPMPCIGDLNELWRELSGNSYTLTRLISEGARHRAEEMVHGLPRPIVLLHTHGTTLSDLKSLPNEMCIPLYNQLLDTCAGSIVLLDWDFRVPEMVHSRVRHLRREWGQVSLEQLAGLISVADAFIGVDSGPLHFCGLFDLPTMGLWTKFLPWHLGLKPKNNTIHLSPPSEKRRELMWDWHLVETSFDPNTDVAKATAEIVRCAKYLLDQKSARRLPLADDLIFSSLLAKTRAETPNSARADRDISFSMAFERLAVSSGGIIVETGCVRSSWDWGAGFFGFLAATWIARAGRGHLFSIDNNERNLRTARDILKTYQSEVTLVHEDSVRWLETNQISIDLLYLDSLDTNDPEHADHCLLEAQAALRCVSGTGIILIDDTFWRNGGWEGKGRLAVPWLLARGWVILYAGYQVLLERSST